MRWTLKPQPELHQVKTLQDALQVDSTVATLLLQRGIETYAQAKQFFRPQLSQLHDPYLMKDMTQAVARIERAFLENERILVYGDYDVDGTTSVALMASYLKTKHAHVQTYIPDRYTEGYGVSYQGIQHAQSAGCTLIIALDCGIKAVEKIAHAQTLGIDFIICDHHRPSDTLPEAIAVLDPKRSDCPYPYKELCGCGVGFKLIQALAQKNHQTAEDLLPYLDLVATAICADIVPIADENRVLTYFGLQVINTNPRPGIKAICQQLKNKPLNATNIVFGIAPRINAAGRIKHGKHAVELLMATDSTAQKIANDIEFFNTERRTTDQEITEAALEQIERHHETTRLTTVVYDPSWHKGVIGIVASRLIETYHRPTLVFTKSGDHLAASARSVPGFDIYNALEACSSHIEQFGGHKYAAGLTLKPEHYEAFKTAFEATVSKTIDKQLLRPEIKIDMPIALKEITPKLYRILEQFAPFGPANMTPVFMTDQMRDTGKGGIVGHSKKHLRMHVTQTETDNEFAAIGFGLADKHPLIKDQKPFCAAYTIDENRWQNQISLQLKLRAIR